MSLRSGTSPLSIVVVQAQPHQAGQAIQLGRYLTRTGCCDAGTAASSRSGRPTRPVSSRTASPQRWRRHRQSLPSRSRHGGTTIPRAPTRTVFLTPCHSAMGVSFDQFNILVASSPIRASLDARRASQSAIAPALAVSARPPSAPASSHSSTLPTFTVTAMLSLASSSSVAVTITM